MGIQIHQGQLLHEEMKNVQSLIPIVENLRRQIKENINKQSLNIERKRPKKGFIIEDEEDATNKKHAPSIENIANISKTVKERTEKKDSFKKQQMRNQFRSISPDEASERGQLKADSQMRYL